jgi:hypothetical protein
MNKEGIKPYELFNQNSTIHDNLEAQTISSEAKSAGSSPIQKNWASKVF